MEVLDFSLFFFIRRSDLIFAPLFYCRHSPYLSHTHTNTLFLSYTWSKRHYFTHTSTHPYTHTHTSTHPYTHTHTHSHTHTHTHTHSHSHTQDIQISHKLSLKNSEIESERGRENLNCNPYKRLFTHQHNNAHVCTSCKVSVKIFLFTFQILQTLGSISSTNMNFSERRRWKVNFSKDTALFHQHHCWNSIT